MAFIHEFTEGNWDKGGKTSKYKPFPETEMEEFILRKNGLDAPFDSISIGNKSAQVALIPLDNTNSEANAKLIAAAPKLLQFAEMLHDHWNSRDEEPFLLKSLKETLTAAGVEITH